MNDNLQSRTERGVGPEFLSNLWDEHMRHEFATHNTEDTLATMVDDAYVNHIPVLTGGVGKDALREFYSKRFIPQMPPDTEVTPVSRTIGADQLVDEMISSSTTPCRWIGLFPVFLPPANGWKCHWSPSFVSAATSWPTNIFIGTRLLSWSNSASWIPQDCR